jgi:uracil-DNA glycosylase
MVNDMSNVRNISQLSKAISDCRVCRDESRENPLPHEPRPVCVLSDTAKIAICGQAPGIRVHHSGIPFTDPSGDRLRSWLGLDEPAFYDSSRLAIVPMGFCFPGYDKKGADLPPRPECRETWHDRVFDSMPQLRLVILVGQYAQAYHLRGHDRRDPDTGKPLNLTQTVRNWRIFSQPTPSSPAPQARTFAMPHPSWRNNKWLKQNSWFEEEMLPVVRQLVQKNI